ncbi:hypothetical protein ACFOOK_17510 [Micromonospora krabiensis]|uniref:Uncharacterized protein n=1 Tax=Micromonospora krabiensis TaxID=307121 RepID=A0A1C3MZI3_9ACTN|nr:hypothetical protein [Micromonospora krabiensis]SBV25756.1 hypothetical protein GA0070620_1236 [Micromonospora krabiensis]
MFSTKATGPTRSAIAVLVGLVVALAGGATPAYAVDPGEAAKARTTPAYQLARGETCGLRPSAGKSPKDEAVSCVGVEAKLDRTPAVGETATLRVTVRGQGKIGPSDISITLPAELEWVRAPGELGVQAQRSVQPERAGAVSVARTTRALRAGEDVAFSGVVRAVKPGAVQIQARATAPYGTDVQAGQDDVFLTIGEKAGLSRFGHAAATGDNTTARVPSSARVPRSAGQTPKSVGVQNVAGEARAEATAKGLSVIGPQAACDTRVAGNWSFQDQNGGWHNQMNMQVQVWDDDVFGDSLLATGVTDGAGNYNICFDSKSEGFPDSGNADIYVRFVTSNNLWRVQRGGNPLTFTTGTTNDVPTGSTLNLGSLTAADGALQRGLHAYDSANDAWLWVPKPNNLCWDQDDASCRQVVINWAPDSTDGTYYNLGSNQVHLAADDPNAPTTVVHEIGHAVMDDLYNDSFPSAPNCNPHSVTGASSAGCAWTEGWAEWFPATVYNDPFFRWPSGASLNLENASWGNGWGEGDTTEGRVAAALIDITDSTNEGTWDRYGEGPFNIWTTSRLHNSATFAAFWNDRAADGFNVADSGARASVYQNTIDYQFRDPLGNYAPLTRPTPAPPHNFGYSTSSPYWSVVALKPNSGDLDLQLYDDRAQGAYLSGSAWGGTAVDFVAVDSNRRALGDYYPRVTNWSGGGGYRVELAQGSAVLNAGSSAITMGTNNVVTVRDAYLTAGVPVTISVAATNVGQDAELFVLDSDPANSATWIRTRSGAVASATGGGAGATETVTVTPVRSAWYGVVVINKSGSGNYTLTRS